MVVQDADLEYDPEDILSMLEVMKAEQADIVFGSRFLKSEYSRHHYLTTELANRFLTWLSNLLSGQKLTDMETCYKMVRREILQSLTLNEKRFGFEPEVVAKLAKYRKNGKRLVWKEIPIHYQGRSYEEGKKIGLRDGLRAIYCIVRYNLFH